MGTTPVSSVTVSIEVASRTWQVVARSRGPIAGNGAEPYLLAKFPPPTAALAVRVSAETSRGAEVAYVNAIGPA
jgi:hypothetical protein